MWLVGVLRWTDSIIIFDNRAILKWLSCFFIHKNIVFETCRGRSAESKVIFFVKLSYSLQAALARGHWKQGLPGPVGASGSAISGGSR